MTSRSRTDGTITPVAGGALLRIRAGGLALDGAVALLATAAELSLLLDDGRAATAALIALTVVTGAALLARRRSPPGVLAVTLAGAVALVGIDAAPGGVPALVALYTTAEQCSRRTSLAALVPAVLVLVIGSIAALPVVVAVWGLGAYAQSRRRSLEREREHLARIAVHEERASIARELHDIVAHSVSVTLVGVRGARSVLHASPDVAAETLLGVETTCEQSLTELRRILSLLREPEHGAESRPQPSLAQLDELISGYRDAGMPVRLQVTGAPRPLSGGVELSVFRIVEEALTNVLKHAHPACVVVRLAFLDSRVDVEIVDESPAFGREARETPHAGGHGIVGMRERVALLGGELETGRLQEGGFRVAARLPVGGDT